MLSAASAKAALGQDRKLPSPGIPGVPGIREGTAGPKVVPDTITRNSMVNNAVMEPLTQAPGMPGTPRMPGACSDSITGPSDELAYDDSQVIE